MGDLDQIFEEWRDENSKRNYPFSDDASLDNGAGSLIPNDLFLDARLYLIGGDSDVYLSSIVIAASTVTVTIGDSQNVNAASAQFDYLNAPNVLEFFDGYGRPAGIIVSTPEQLRLMPALFGSSTTFTYDQTAFAASVVVPLPQPGVRGILLDDGSFFTEDVFLIGTKGVVLTQIDAQTIRVDVVGDPYALQQECATEGIAVVPFCGLKTINKIKPDPKTGDFKITPGANPPYASDNVLRVNFADGILTISEAAATGVPKV